MFPRSVFATQAVHGCYTHSDATASTTFALAFLVTSFLSFGRPRWYVHVGLATEQPPSLVRMLTPFDITGLSALDAIAAADAESNEKRLSPGSVNDYFVAYESFVKWTVEHDYVDKSPAVVLYGGLRLEEAAKLRRENLRQEAGMYVLDINRKAGRLKTKNANRLVPVHSAILEPLLKQAQGVPATANLWGLSPSASGTFSAALSRRLNKRLDRAVPENDQLVTYSLRHAFATKVRHAGASESVLDELP